MTHKIDPDVVAWRVIEGDVVAVDLRNSEYFSLSASAQLLWPLLAEGVEEEQLVQCLLSHYDVAPEIARRDVEGLLQDLRQRGVLTPV